MAASYAPESLLQAKIEARCEILERTQVNIPDGALQAAFDWGKLNLADLRLTAAHVQVRDVDEGRAYPEPLLTLNTMTGIAAGFPDYYELFGTDGAYTGYALVVSGQWDTLREHLRTIRDVSRAVNGRTGKVIHEVMTDGSAYYGNNTAAGNTNETAQFAIAVELLWRWSGDDEFRDEMYAFVRDGLYYVMSTLDPDGDYCPSGRGMVEREGMAGQTLDVAAYTWRALNALAHMARSKRDHDTYQWAWANAQALQGTFDSAWWMPEAHLYADSLDSCAQPQLQVQQLHWINAVPLEMGLAPLANAKLVLDRMETATFTGENGLYHTGIGGGADGSGELRVWTLPNGVMAVAEANYGRLGAGQALHYMRAIANSLDLEMPGALPEVLPSPDYNPFSDFRERLMFMQAWSAYGVQYPIIHHMLGIEPFAPTRTLYIVPQLPPEWDTLSVTNLRIGSERIAVSVRREGRHAIVEVNTAYGWTITLGYALTHDAEIAAVMLDGTGIDYKVEQTTRGHEVRVQTTGGISHTLRVTVR
jgi:glycogen debranching enzyme